jgi:diguanylate cyclase (GGDEF)-like protein/PAS domain S-box-containing protein
MTEKTDTRLLLICDDPACSAALVALLDSTSYSYSTRARPVSGRTAVERPTDLVLFVLRADNGGDLENLGEWTETHPEVDVLALIEGGSAAAGARSVAAGAAAWVSLTIDPSDLCGVIDRVVARSRQATRFASEHRRFRDLLENAPIGVFELRGGRVSYVNEHLLQSLGYERGELIGEPPEKLEPVVREERFRMHKAVEERLRGIERSEPNVYHLATKSGGTYVAEVRSRVIETPDGRIVEGTIRDITLETRLAQLQRVVIELGEVILGESDIDRILQLALDTVTEYSGFRRAVLSLYDLSIPVPFDGDVYTTLTSGLTPEERDALLAEPPIPASERKLVFSDRYRLGSAYYIPHDDTPWSVERGIAGSVSVEGWHIDDFLFIPLRGTTGIIGSISVDDPVDRSAPTIASIEPVAALANFAALAVERVFKLRQLQKQKERLHGLSEFGGQLARVSDVRTLCELAVQRVHTDMNYSVCSICIADGQRLVQEAVAAKDLFPADEIPRKGAKVHIDGPGITRWAFRNSQSVLVSNVLEDERYDGTKNTIRSFMAVPIAGRKGAIGVVDVASERIAAFDEQDLEVVSALASQISTAISALRRRDALGRIYSFGQRLATALTRDQAITGTLDFLAEQFDFELSAILLTGEDGLLSVAGLRGPYHDGGIEVGTNLPLGSGIVGWVAENRHPLVVPDVQDDSRYFKAFSGTRSELAVPVLFGGNLLGIVNVESQQAGFFDDEDRQLLEVIANHLAIALSNLASQEVLRERAIRDPLTGLFNRHYFNSIIASELSRVDRYDRPMSLMMIDIDGFRTVNNKFGHLRGDEVLREIARMLERSVRAADRVIRYGGDEFLVLMPETDGKRDAAVVVDRLHKRIKEIPEQTGIKGHTIDLSIGLYTREAHEKRSLEAILEEVDRRMYADKRTKRVDDDRS